MKKGILFSYGKYLPLTEKTPMLSLCEGDTPLVPLRNLSRELGVGLFGKYDGLNPTGSFKDRGWCSQCRRRSRKGRAVICASTGNTSASAAAYAAVAGIPCFVLLPAGKVALGKLAQAMIYGARVLAVRVISTGRSKWRGRGRSRTGSPS